MILRAIKIKASSALMNIRLQTTCRSSWVLSWFIWRTVLQSRGFLCIWPSVSTCWTVLPVCWHNWPTKQWCSSIFTLLQLCSFCCCMLANKNNTPKSCPQPPNKSFPIHCTDSDASSCRSRVHHRLEILLSWKSSTSTLTYISSRSIQHAQQLLKLCACLHSQETPCL